MSGHRRRAPLGLLLLAAGILPAHATAQGTGPPGGGVSILPPIRSTAEQDSAIKRETLPPLTLPDIILYGRGSIAAREGSMLFSSQKRTVLDREVGGITGEKEASEATGAGLRLLAAREGLPTTHRVRAYLRGGTLGEALAGVDYWGENERLRMLAHASLDRTGGHVANSAALQGLGRFSLLYPLSPFTEVRLRTFYEAGSAQEWAATVPFEAQRSWHYGGYAAEIESHLRRGLTVRASTGGRHAGLLDEVRVPGTSLRPVSRGGWAEAQMEWTQTHLLLDLSARTEWDRLSGVLSVQRPYLTRMRLSGRSAAGSAGSLLLGGTWYVADGGLGQARRIWPVAEFTSQYTERFSTFIRYEPRMRYLTLGEAHRINPFVANTYQVVPVEERFHLAIGLTYEMAPRTRLGFEITRRIFDRLAVWRQAPVTEPESAGLFIQEGLTSLGINETRLSLQAEPFRGMPVAGAIVLRQASGAGVSELPHIPRLEMEGTVGFPAPRGMAWGLELRHLGERFGTTEATAGSRIVPSTDIALSASRGFGERLTFWLEVRNLLGRNLMMWEGYPLPGRTSVMGLSVRF